jgi:hypothetical protein
VEDFRDLPCMQEARERAKAAFHAKFERTLAYQLLSLMRAYDPTRLERLEAACWSFRCAAIRKELKGARARQALSLLGRLERELGEPSWPDEQVAVALDLLREKLQSMASKRGPGRPRDSLGQTFRRNMQIFFSRAVLTEGGWRALSRGELDEILSDLFKLATGRTLAHASYVRMRKREQAADHRLTFATPRTSSDHASV